MNRLSIALVHYPCVDAQGDIYATAITNMDIHDISRSARTYDLATYYVITPLASQRELAETIKKHWCESEKRQQTDRAQALSLLRVCSSLEDAVEIERQTAQAEPYLLATSAKLNEPNISFANARVKIKNQPSSILILGTGHGLAESVLSRAHEILEPIYGKSDYNHLSVRSAAAILIDRLA